MNVLHHNTYKTKRENEKNVVCSCLFKKTIIAYNIYSYLLFVLNTDKQ